MEELSVKNVTKYFKISDKQKKALGLSENKKLAVNDVSFTAHSGEIFGLLGTNGAGKTTTMRMISTLIKPDSGNVWLGGVNIIEEPEAVRGNLAFLTTDLKLDGKSTANDMFDFFAALHHITREKRKERLIALFHRCGVGKFGDR
ncbi:MAG: ATP-binding cassette domain-containing protein, partial [Lachnospiraceae bacterium]|nr:ATP-binding cassette domain-containing protein [Lachnospiraceae bacterium]